MQEGAEQTTGSSRKNGSDEINDNKKLLLGTIPQLADFSSVDSEMNGRAFVKKAVEIHGIPQARSIRGCIH